MKLIHSFLQIPTLLAGIIVAISSLARADCGETPLRYSDLLQIAEQPAVTDIVSFLQHLPRGSASLSTLVHTSQSLQKDAITPLKPGVIRSTAEGKLIFRYVCELEHPLARRIEVMRFDEEEKQFKFSSIRLGSRDQKAVVTENPAECLKCHLNENRGHALLRPNWNSYPQWPGFYGSDDDYLHPSADRQKYSREEFPEQLKPEVEESNFHQFAKNEAANPCYTLSFPMGLANSYRDKYRLFANRRTQAKRPNHKLSIDLGYLYAQTLAAQIVKRPGYERLQRAVLEAALGCNGLRDPDYEFDKNGEILAPRFGLNGELLQLLDRLGYDINDLQMSLHNIVPYDYVGGFLGGKSFDDNDLTFLSILRTQLVEAAAREHPELKLHYRVSRAMTEYYTDDQDACIDDLGGRLVLSAEDRKQACEIVAGLHGEPAGAILKSPSSTSPAVTDSKLMARIAEVKSRPGFQAVMETCGRCHAQGGDRPIPQYLADPDRFARSLLQKELAKRMRARIESATSPMPPDRELDPAVKSTILEFLKEFP